MIQKDCERQHLGFRKRPLSIASRAVTAAKPHLTFPRPSRCLIRRMRNCGGTPRSSGAERARFRTTGFETQKGRQADGAGCETENEISGDGRSAPAQSVDSSCGVTTPESAARTLVCRRKGIMGIRTVLSLSSWIEIGAKVVCVRTCSSTRRPQSSTVLQRTQQDRFESSVHSARPAARQPRQTKSGDIVVSHWQEMKVGAPGPQLAAHRC